MAPWPWLGSGATVGPGGFFCLGRRRRRSVLGHHEGHKGESLLLPGQPVNGQAGFGARPKLHKQRPDVLLGGGVAEVPDKDLAGLPDRLGLGQRGLMVAPWPWQPLLGSSLDLAAPSQRLLGGGVPLEAYQDISLLLVPCAGERGVSRELVLEGVLKGVLDKVLKGVLDGVLSNFLKDVLNDLAVSLEVPLLAPACPGDVGGGSVRLWRVGI